MKYDGTSFGIIPDTFQTILNDYLTPLQDTFPNATSPNSPAYTISYINATQEQKLQAALVSLWNAFNANTAQGLGLDILASTVLNLTRPAAVPSVCQINLVVNPIKSVCFIQLTVTAGTFPQTLVATTWAPTGTVTSPVYHPLADIVIDGLGTYYFNVYSTDTITPVPAGGFTGGSAIPTVTFSVTNTSSAVLGSLTIPTTWGVTASGITNSPVYSPNAPQTFIAAGTYTFLVYSNNITQQISNFQIDTMSDHFGGLLDTVTNPYPAILGRPALTDAQFMFLRRYYLNVQGQTYYGLEKSIVDLQVPGLNAVFVDETISESTNYSILIIKVVVDATLGAVIFPVGWAVGLSAGPFPAPSYATLESYTFVSSGTFYIPVYSADIGTAVPIGAVSTSSPPVTGLTSIENLDPAVLGSTLVPNGLGKRGYTVYLQYPTINPKSYCVMQINVSAVGGSPPYTIPIGWTASGFSTTAPYMTQQTYTINTTGTYLINLFSTDLVTVVPISGFTGGSAVAGLTFTASNTTQSQVVGTFDVNDPYLQQIAFTAFKYHALGTNFYPASVGSTLFVVPTPYSGYTSNVYLNPFQKLEISCNLLLVYNSDPNDAGFNNGIFDTSQLPTLQSQILVLINQYFLSKTLPTDLMYSINELTEIIQQTFTGIVALVGNTGGQFSFGTFNPTVTGQLFLRRVVGYNYELTNSNFTFAYKDKDA